MPEIALEVTISRSVRVGLSDDAIRAILRLARRFIGGKIASVAVAFVSAGEIRKLNKKYRGKDSPTDVLSFSYGEEVDIVVCPTKTRQVWGPRGKGVREGLAFVLVHGVLHASGHHHENQKTFEKTIALNEKIVLEAKKRGYV